MSLLPHRLTTVRPATHLVGPADGTIDPDHTAFGGHVKAILRNFCEMGFKTIYAIIMHQGMEAPLALAFKKAAAELAFESILERGYPQRLVGRGILEGRSRTSIRSYQSPTHDPPRCIATGWRRPRWL